ncbi:DUF559 domain-containing protein [Leucobacter sp. GX24907]
MPRPRSPIPDLPPAFGVGEALEKGMSAEALRHPSLESPFFGVRVRPDRVPASTTTLHDEMIGQARMFTPRMRTGEAVSHTSALVIYRCPIRWNRRLHVTAAPGFAPNRTAGVIGHGSSVVNELRIIEGVSVVSPAVALLQSADLLPLRELVVAIDHFVLPRGPKRRSLLAREEVLELAERFRGRGSRKLRQAARLSRVGAESRMETLTRLVLVAFGLDHNFELQVNLSDRGGWIGRFDLVARDLRLIVEYDGDHHRTDKAQHRRDLRRLARARKAGFEVLQLLDDDIISTPRATAENVARELGMSISEHPLLRELLALPAT